MSTAVPLSAAVLSMIVAIMVSDAEYSALSNHGPSFDRLRVIAGDHGEFVEPSSFDCDEYIALRMLT